ncbi:ATP-binding protein [Actinoallomurus spadix]|uniref:Histidine kinase/HSP90-like ATPase domain-containing protein n=1 Tax=Actinoallomurus spadix TaxID=79912 RepID=A0ABP3HC05_9ACTN|nr:ATP-binding protein [Actinoallomurus spadix]MCO5984978.1 ATP-binding protein [Actinoallomurus spadix]
MLLTRPDPAAAAPAMYWRAVFPGTPDQAHAVRAFVATLLPGRPRLDEIILAVGELVANALRHTRSGQGGSFTVDVYHAAGRTEISVTDQGGPAEPAVTDADDLAEGGRGLRTIAFLADGWGWHGDDQGRTVTAVFTAEPPATAVRPCPEPVSPATAEGR